MAHFKDSDLEISHLKGSGPGGQNRNKRLTAVRIVHIPTGIAVTATDSRSQAQNLEAAKERLAERLERHYFKPKKRHATRPTKGSKRRRVEDKKHRSSIKSGRGRPSDD